MNEAVSSNRYSLIGLEVDDATMAQLLEMARRHCKLVLEYGRAQTSAERRREIREEIKTLRSEREALIARVSRPIIFSPKSPV
ncbi:hypothetical protein [Caldibacillus debilis]|uniref:hypothetical protein n=1 Tax=Caldibacillus debilis TaxID=301148 RepID=UPI0023F09101|nr:hypothetical protein [Caldibacillus debilis]